VNDNALTSNIYEAGRQVCAYLPPPSDHGLTVFQTIIPVFAFSTHQKVS
jgi:hypothetical protein